MMHCLQFLIEPAKNFTVKLKESHKKAKDEKREPLDECQEFIVNLAKDLSRVCQVSEVLEHITSCEDVWPTLSCRAFILEWASLLESKKRPLQTDGWPEKSDWKELALSSEQDVENAKRLIMTWIKDLRAQPEQSVCPGEQVVMVLEDLEKQWRRGRVPTLQTAVELIFWTLLTKELNKENIPKQWLIWKQKSQKIGAIPYIPQSVEVTMDQDTANPDLLISADKKRMRCGFERQDVPNYHQRFDGWWCTVGTEGFGMGRRYWEVDVGDMDWRLGVAKESALRKGFKSLNTNTGYLTLRLERGIELKALTVPFTALPESLIPRKVGVYLDYEHGQLSFYDTERRSHIYTYNERFDEKLFPLFGTVEIVSDLVIRSPGDRGNCLCLWG
ncbi:E3 ubiquitin-protein ligase TRIM58 isoform X2 [Tachysurus fulvidraco]|uniref:E3 ubiquitin-protein ligase TRIM58 isoform X2 n=1 Tax=Tachysurus fulvidraco TaxID=1234273 RepID=UPI001FEDFA3D|nr:E3 ubiquitin-protein ligase TRIM58 isoform X2 [Tachysurus fulvidraco]